MLALLALFACNSTPEPLYPALPAVWGPTAAQNVSLDENIVEVHLSAGMSSTTWVDGSPTDTWAYNDQVPGPLIHAWLGQTLRVVFTNNLNEPTTIHWHSLRIDNAMDGVPAVQAPIQPGETFTYEFTPPDSGSYWYHPHMRSNEQVERGLQGTLIVHELDAPAVDNDRYFVLDDVSLTSTGGFTSFSIPGMEQMHGRYGNTLLLNGEAELVTDTIRPRAVERWRLVNTANARTMYMTLQGADARVIAVDGTLLPTPFAVTGELQVPIGQRLDLEVIPQADAAQVTLQNVVPTNSGTASIPLFEATVQGEPGDGLQRAWPAAPLPVVQPSRQHLQLDLGAVQVAGAIEWQINGVAFADSEPFVVTQSLPSTLKIRNQSGPEHPFHLHGQFFQILERDGEPVDEPGLRDTVLIPGMTDVLISTDFSNPGMWMAHCHILEHAELGMMSMIEVMPPEMPPAR